MAKSRASFDTKDLKIVRALDKYGPKATMKELSATLKIPPRTLRYRLSRLRAHGYLQPFRYFTYERKIGLGEQIVVLNLSSSEKPFPTEFFVKTPIVGWYSSTYGKMNGYLMNIIYPLESPTLNIKILDSLIGADLISDYSIFNLVSYSIKGLDLSKFDSNGRWKWDWNIWHHQIDSILKSGQTVAKMDLEEEAQIPFDSKDVYLLKMLHENSNVTQKILSLKLDLSISQVRKRFQRLQEYEVIRGHKPIFTPFSDTLTLMCFIEAGSSVGQILTCIYELPYTLDIYFESLRRIGMRIRLSTSDIVGFFRGLDRMRHLADSISVQILHDTVSFGSSRLYDLYDATEGKWMTQSLEYLEWLRDWLTVV